MHIIFKRFRFSFPVFFLACQATCRAQNLTTDTSRAPWHFVWCMLRTSVAQNIQKLLWSTIDKSFFSFSLATDSSIRSILGSNLGPDKSTWAQKPFKSRWPADCGSIFRILASKWEWEINKMNRSTWRSFSNLIWPKSWLRNYFSQWDGFWIVFRVDAGSMRNRFGIASGLIRDWFGVNPDSIRGRFGIVSQSIQDRFGVDSGSFQDNFGIVRSSIFCIWINQYFEVTDGLETRYTCQALLASYVDGPVFRSTFQKILHCNQSVYLASSPNVTVRTCVHTDLCRYLRANA